MNTAASTVVDGLSAFISQLGRRRFEMPLVNVGSDVCVAIPARFVDERAADRRSGNAVARQRAVSASRGMSEDREYLSSWQFEMEDFDRF